MKVALIFSVLFSSKASFADFSTDALRIPRAQNEIILTFDDGPTPGVTNKILNTLKKNHIRATFFVRADNASKYPELMSRIVNEGHVVGNHSYSHLVLNNLEFASWEQVLKTEVYKAHEIIAPYLTNSKNFYYRAPGGYWEPRFAKLLNENQVSKNYIGPIHWDIGGKLEVSGGRLTKAADWECWSKKIPVGECLSGYIVATRQARGEVVLMHDLHPQTAEMLERYITLLGNGYTFRTLDDLD